MLKNCFLHVWARVCIHILDSCIRSFILVYVGMFLRSCVHGDGLAYVGSCLRTWALTRVRETLGKSPTLPIFTPFCHFCTWISLYPYFYLNSCIENIIFIIYAWIKNLMSSSSSFFFFGSHHPLMLVGEALIKWWNCTNFLPLKVGPTSERQALSPSLVFFHRGLRALPWCSASLKGGGILPTPFILSSESDFLWFLPHD